MTLASILFVVMMTIMIAFLVINSFQALLLICAVPEVWSHWQLADDEYFHTLVGAEALPPISVIAAVSSRQHNVVDFAQMLMGLEYPRFEVVLCTDGADGDVLQQLQAAFDLYAVPPAFTINLPTEPVRTYYRSRTYPRLVCLDKPSTGAGDALNAALNASRYPHAMIAAANVVFEPDALLRLSRPLLLDRSVACVGGVLRPANLARADVAPLAQRRIGGWTVGCQTIEYLRNFLFQRLGWNRVASNIVFPSGTILFKREDLFGLGGFNADDESPGIEIAVKLHRYLTDTGVNARMPVIQDPVAWSLIPEDIAAIGLARRRWIRGLSRSLRQNARMCLNPEYGAFGMIAIPYLWLGIIAAPVLELLGYIGLVAGIATGVLDSSFTWAYLASVIGYGILLSVWTVVYQAISFRRADQTGGISRLLAYSVIESLGYRQMLALYRATAFFVERQPIHHHG